MENMSKKDGKIFLTQKKLYRVCAWFDIFFQSVTKHCDTVINYVQQLLTNASKKIYVQRNDGMESCSNCHICSDLFLVLTRFDSILILFFLIPHFSLMVTLQKF